MGCTDVATWRTRLNRPRAAAMRPFCQIALTSLATECDWLDAVVCVEISSTKHFVYLPAERLYRILSDDNLNVQSEMEVFCALLQWLDFDRQERMCMAPRLLQCCVRLQFIPPEQLITKVEPVDWLFENPDCEFLVNEAIRSVSRPTGRWLN